MSYLDTLFSLSGKTAIVTGAARGNGAAMALALGKAGANVVLVDRLTSDLAQVQAEFNNAGIKSIPLGLDIAGESAPSEIVDATVSAFGGIQVLVNNAGITRGHPIFEYPDSDWDSTHAVNLRAPFRLSKAAAAVMCKTGGSIINITSINSELAFPNNPAYMAAKGGLKQLSKSLAMDLAPFGIRVNCIGPGYFQTEMTQQSYNDPVRRQQRADRTLLGRWGTPSDLAGAVIFLASDASSYLTGQDLYIDGGWIAKGL